MKNKQALMILIVITMISCKKDAVVPVNKPHSKWNYIYRTAELIRDSVKTGVGGIYMYDPITIGNDIICTETFNDSLGFRPIFKYDGITDTNLFYFHNVESRFIATQTIYQSYLKCIIVNNTAYITDTLTWIKNNVIHELQNAKLHRNEDNTVDLDYYETVYSSPVSFNHYAGRYSVK